MIPETYALDGLPLVPMGLHFLYFTVLICTASEQDIIHSMFYSLACMHTLKPHILQHLAK